MSDARSGEQPGATGGADTTATVATILAEVRDTAGPNADRDHVAEMIRSRAERAGVELADGELDELTTQLVEGHD